MSITASLSGLLLSLTIKDDVAFNSEKYILFNETLFIAFFSEIGCECAWSTTKQRSRVDTLEYIIIKELDNKSYGKM